MSTSDQNEGRSRFGSMPLALEKKTYTHPHTQSTASVDEFIKMEIREEVEHEYPARKPAPRPCSPRMTIAHVLNPAQEGSAASLQHPSGVGRAGTTPATDPVDVSDLTDVAELQTDHEATEEIEIMAAPTPAANVVREFICEIESGCQGTQFLKSQSRHCVSDHFGRNKKCTRMIERPITWCRSCYQRKAYKKNWPGRKIGLIREQLRRIEEQEHGVTYTVALKHSEQERLNSFNNGNGTNEPERNPNDKGYRAPIEVLQHLYTNWINTGAQTLDDCLELVDYVASLWSEDPTTRTIDDLPSFELLPNFAALGPKDNHGRAKATVIPKESRNTAKAPDTTKAAKTKSTKATKTAAPVDSDADCELSAAPANNSKKRKAAAVEATEEAPARRVKKPKFSLTFPPCSQRNRDDAI